MKTRSLTIASLIIVTILVIGIFPAFGQGEVGYSDNLRKINVGSHARYLSDPKDDIGFADLLTYEREGLFKEHINEVFQLGLSQESHWIAFSINDLGIENHLVNWKDYFIYLNNSGIERINLFLPVNENGEMTYHHYRGGFFYEGFQNETGHFFPVFELPGNLDEESPLYINVKSDYSKNFSITIEEKNQFFAHQQMIVLVLSVAFGIMIAMILYNLVLFFALKDSLYVLYVGYMLFMLIYQLGVTGFLKIISFHWGEALENYVIIATFASIVFALFFASSFLNVSRCFPKVKPFILAVCGICLVGIALVLLEGKFYANYLAYFPGAVMPFFLVVLAIESVRRGNLTARYYLLATVVLFTSVIVYVLQGFGVLSHSYATVYAMTISVSLEGLLLSFALAHRISYMRKEQESYQKREIEMSRMMLTDSMTGLFNRRYFDGIHKKICKQARKEKTSVSLIYLDVDNFKVFNDTYGHPAGDQVLKSLAEVIKSNTRDQDHPCRIGGEEFAVVFPKTDGEQAKRIAERIRKQFEEMDLSRFASTMPTVTVSIGVAMLKEDEPCEDWIFRTDKALYNAKRRGKNEVFICEG